MTFLNNVSRGLNTAGNNIVASSNPFSQSKPSANPFGGAPRPSSTPTGVPTGAPMGIPMGRPAGIPTPSFAKPQVKKEVVAPVKVTTPKVETKVDVEQVSMAEVKTEVKAPSFVKKVVENKDDVIIEAAPVEAEKTVKKTRSRKKTVPAITTASEVVTSEEAQTVEKIFKMPTTKMTYADAVQATRGAFVDEEWEAHKKEILTESDAIVIENGMTGSAINTVSSQLNQLREKIWVTFTETKVLLETLSRKDTEGLIERVKYMNMEGSSSEMRKRSAVMAVMSYKTPQGATINLYEVYDETKARMEFLRGIMETISFKSSSLITINTASK